MLRGAGGGGGAERGARSEPVSSLQKYDNIIIIVFILYIISMTRLLTTKSRFELIKALDYIKSILN